MNRKEFIEQQKAEAIAEQKKIAARLYNHFNAVIAEVIEIRSEETGTKIEFDKDNPDLDIMYRALESYVFFKFSQFEHWFEKIFEVMDVERKLKNRAKRTRKKQTGPKAVH